MIKQKERRDILKRGLSEVWQAEPMLGSIYGEEEIEAVVASIRSSMKPTIGFGFICEEIERFEQTFASYIGTKHAISLCTASVGLEMAMICLDLEPGDEIICPSINFRAAPMAILGRGGRLVLCEVEESTLCADPDDVERKITPRTRAILVTHMNGMSARIDDLLEIAQRHPHPKHGPPKVIGDAARALGAGYSDKKIGTMAWMTIFSFHTMKNMTTLGEGGAITTDDDAILARLSQMRQFGDEYWGSSYKLTKSQAAVGMVQLKRLDNFIAARRRLAYKRHELLAGCHRFQLPHEPEGHHHSYYVYTILTPKEWAGEKRDKLIDLLRAEYMVDCRIFNPPVHEEVPFIARHTTGQSLPRSSELGRRIFCPPIHPAMSDEDNEYIAAAIWEAADRIAGEA